MAFRVHHKQVTTLDWKKCTLLVTPDHKQWDSTEEVLIFPTLPSLKLILGTFSALGPFLGHGHHELATY